MPRHKLKRLQLKCCGCDRSSYQKVNFFSNPLVSTTSKIALVFSPDFPCELAGRTRELICAPGKSVFLIGKGPACDIQISFQFFSRIHATIVYRSDTKAWTILDGGVYSDTEEYRPSTNGIWIDGERMKIKEINVGGEKVKQGDTELIVPSTKICLGHPDAKVFVAPDKHHTVQNFVWEQPGWPEFQPVSNPMICDAGLKQQIIEESSGSGGGPWVLATEAFRWFSKPSKTWQDTLLKILLLAAATIIAIAVVKAVL